MIGKLKKGAYFGGCVRYVTGKDEAKILASDGVLLGTYNPQNEMFSHLGTKRYNFKNETQLFKVIPHTSKFQKNRPASPERNTFEGS